MTDDDKYAFACAAENGHQPGMTLRDYFAAHAMSALIAKLPLKEAPAGDMSFPEKVAGGAYDYADAMLAARK